MGRQYYLGRTVQLFPGDTYSKFAVIEDVDDYGWQFRITKCDPRCGYKMGQVIFYNHSHNVTFIFID